MAGSMRGCAARITEECPKALYMDCSSHCLNLCVVALSNITLVHNMWAVLKALNLFYKYSPKRALSLETTIKQSETRATVSRKKKLVDLCKTRWVARHSALVIFADLFEPLVTNLELIFENKRWPLECRVNFSSNITTNKYSKFFLHCHIRLDGESTWLHPAAHCQPAREKPGHLPCIRAGGSCTGYPAGNP